MTFHLGPSSSAYSLLQEIPARFDIRNGVIVVAWARTSGVGLLYSALGESFRNVDVVVGMANRGTTAEAIAHLQSRSRNVFVYHKHFIQTFHPKVYLFDDGQKPPSNAALLVGSSNLTGGGLYQNIEGNLALHLEPANRVRDRETFDSVIQAVSGLLGSPFCEQLSGEKRISQLLEDGYISTEATLNQKRRSEIGQEARLGDRRLKPEAPPPPLPHVSLPPLPVTFGGVHEAGPTYGQVHPDGHSIAFGDYTTNFYVRTLTVNDVNKLHGRTPGTAEWDIGLTARDSHPVFWGWPDHYTDAAPNTTRLEWRSPGRLRSSMTRKEGVEVEVCLWFREKRQGHAAEHRLRIGPKPNLVSATPSNFDRESLVVLERLPEGRTHVFDVWLLTNQDAGYHDYLPYLTQTRPQHSFGYGP